MLVGESTLLALLLSGSLVVLFVLAQRRKQQREDMEKLLQFTSHEFKTPVAGVKGLLQSLAIGSIPDGAARRADPARAASNATGSNISRKPSSRTSAPCRAIRAKACSASMRRVSSPTCSRIARAPSSGGEVRGRDHRRGAGAGRSRRTARDPREPARQRAQVRRRQRAPRRGRARRPLAARHQRPGTRLRATSAEKLFDLHNRGSGEGVTHGAGLGLAIARQLARRMGGDISAPSSRARGRARCSP